MKIPAVRDELEEIASDLKTQKGRNWRSCAQRIEALVPELKRRPAKRRAKTREEGPRTPLTESQKKEIARFTREHPEMMLQDIGSKFGVNQGRVSEIIAGFRK